MPSPNRPWTAEIGLRMRRDFPLKLFGTTAFTCLFFVGYFQLLRHPANPVVLMPLTVLDRWIAFEPSMLAVYLSLWLYIGVGPGLQRTLRELFVYAAWASALCATGLAIFYAWPTAVPPLALDLTAGHAGFRLLQGIDAAGNACPSMHVAIAMFTMIRVERLLRGVGVPWPLRTFNLAWFAAIAWSTLATKQHVVLDVAAGALLGAAFALASLHWRSGVRSLASRHGRVATP